MRQFRKQPRKQPKRKKKAYIIDADRFDAWDKLHDDDTLYLSRKGKVYAYGTMDGFKTIDDVPITHFVKASAVKDIANKNQSRLTPDELDKLVYVRSIGKLGFTEVCRKSIC